MILVSLQFVFPVQKKSSLDSSSKLVQRARSASPSLVISFMPTAPVVIQLILNSGLLIEKTSIGIQVNSSFSVTQWLFLHHPPFDLLQSLIASGCILHEALVTERYLVTSITYRTKFQNPKSNLLRSVIPSALQIRIKLIFGSWYADFPGISISLPLGRGKLESYWLYLPWSPENVALTGTRGTFSGLPLLWK